MVIGIKHFAIVIVGLLFAVNISVAQNSDEKPELSKPVEAGENYKVYGSEFPEKAKFFAPGYLIKNSDVFTGKEVAVKGGIKQVCQKKGCFFFLADGENEIRVTFEDYSFFIPTDAAGKDVQVVGSFQVKELSEDQAKHNAEDAGGNPDKVEGDQKEYGIVASSVKIIDTE